MEKIIEAVTKSTAASLKDGNKALNVTVIMQTAPEPQHLAPAAITVAETHVQAPPQAAKISQQQVLQALELAHKQQREE